MLGCFLFSFWGAVICAMMISAIVFFITRKDGYRRKNTMLTWAIVIFVTEFVMLMIVFYCLCLPQTLVTLMTYVWVPLLIIILFYNLFIKDNVSTAEPLVILVVAVISAVFCLGSRCAPVQNLIYVHDMKDVDVAYAISSDEVLAKMELQIDNSKFADRYSIESPEMRQVDGKNVAVYHIKNNEDNMVNTEYIPGYAIQEANELPKIVSKRIYFDTSYFTKKDALRTIRRKYPTVILGDHKFDIDDNWNPYEVYEYRENLFYTNGKDYGLIILNLRDGTCEKYPASKNEIPSWVDFETTYPR